MRKIYLTAVYKGNHFVVWAFAFVFVNQLYRKRLLGNVHILWTVNLCLLQSTLLFTGNWASAYMSLRLFAFRRRCYLLTTHIMAFTLCIYNMFICSNTQISTIDYKRAVLAFCGFPIPKYHMYWLSYPQMSAVTKSIKTQFLKNTVFQCDIQALEYNVKKTLRNALAPDAVVL